MGCGASTAAPGGATADAAPEKYAAAAPKPAKAASAKPLTSKPAGGWDMKEVFKQFDTDGDGVLDMGEFQRAFRAIGLKKRDGSKFQVDQAMFNSFDKNGDGKIDIKEFDTGLHKATRKKIEGLLDAGWKFDADLWAKSVERHAHWDMAKVFKQFDTNGDGELDMDEFKRAFRALGLKKRDGDKYAVDQEMFKSFDTSGDGKVQLEEFEKNMKPRTREKIEGLLDAGWKFDAKLWEESEKRHKEWDMQKVFKQFDTDGDGVLDFREFQRAFRALGLKKRDGSKYDVDIEMFKSFDTNGDGHVSMEEFDKNIKPRTREKITSLLDAGWKFDPALWMASLERHKDDPPFDAAIAYGPMPKPEGYVSPPAVDMKELFAQFDTDGDGTMDIGEFQRAFRAIGLKKRDGSKYEVDQEMFNSFDSNGDGKISLQEFEDNVKPRTRAKLEEMVNAGWKFDAELWAASQARHAKWDMSKVFKQFDTNGDGELDMDEFKRAFRALGLKNRDGEKYAVDQEMFNSFDSNGDGKIQLEEFEKNIKPRTREKIETLLDAGWKFDHTLWEESEARHATWDMSKVFKQFDTDGDGALDFREFQRAFRALGLKKRDGEKHDVDIEMFKSFDTSGDGHIQMEEFEKNMKPRTREKIVELLDAGWKFDPELWKASAERHAGDAAYDPELVGK